MIPVRENSELVIIYQETIPLTEPEIYRILLPHFTTLPFGKHTKKGGKITIMLQVDLLSINYVHGCLSAMFNSNFDRRKGQFNIPITPPNLNVAPANKKQGFQHSPCSSKTPGEVIYIG